MVAVGAWLAHAGLFHWREQSFAELRAGAPLSPEVRAQLRPRMRRHGQAMIALTNAVMMVDHDQVIALAEPLLADPQLAQPLVAEAATLASALPSQFHEYEAALQAHARELIAAARAGDDEELIAAAARLAWTCARCHAAFHGP